jgi:hypothetical protein
MSRKGTYEQWRCKSATEALDGDLGVPDDPEAGDRRSKMDTNHRGYPDYYQRGMYGQLNAG